MTNDFPVAQNCCICYPSIKEENIKLKRMQKRETNRKKKIKSTMAHPLDGKKYISKSSVKNCKSFVIDHKKSWMYLLSHGRKFRMAGSNNCFKHTRGYPFLFLINVEGGQYKIIRISQRGKTQMWMFIQKAYRFCCSSSSIWIIFSLD